MVVTQQLIEDHGQLSQAIFLLRSTIFGLKNTEADDDDDPMELIGIETRLGIMDRMDIGYMRTMDISSYMDDDDAKGADMHIIDIKYQFVDRKKVDASLQFKWGNVINLENGDNEKFWQNMVVFSAGSEFYENRFFCHFTLEFLDDKWHPLPSWIIDNESDISFADLTKQITLGYEIPNRTGLYPVVVVGRQFNDDLSVGNNMINIGVNIYK